MAESQKPTPPAKTRDDRRAEALRANLRRRKEQAREEAPEKARPAADAALPPQSSR